MIDLKIINDDERNSLKEYQTENCRERGDGTGCMLCVVIW